jgi:Domain of unknown function (DUF4832)/Domain of unknown function (DUF4874)
MIYSSQLPNKENSTISTISMSKKIILIFTLLATIFVFAFSFVSKFSTVNSFALAPTQVTYLEDTANTQNPERGFNRNYYGPAIASELQTYKSNKTTLYRPIYDISSFIGQPLSVAFLDQLYRDAAVYRQVGAKLLVNFQYSNGGVVPNDATKTIIVGHLEQLRPYFNDNKDVVALLASSFVGDYGEFTISSNENISYVQNKPYISSGFPTLQDLANGTGGFVVNQNTREIVAKILDVLPKERSFAVRQPATKKQLVNSLSPLTEAEGFSKSDKARLGHQIDSLVGNEYEGATFIYSNNDNPIGRKNEEDYYAQDAKYTPFIGEVEFFDNGASGQCVDALKLIKSRRISSINETYNVNTLNIWKTQGCYEEIAKKLGYRFVLNTSEIPVQASQNQNFNLKLTLQNQGYATPFNERKFEVILRNKSTGAVYPIDLTNQSDPRRWYPENGAFDLNLSVSAAVPVGDYETLLNLPDPVASIKSNPDYSIKFSNQNMLEAATGYNILKQSIKILPSSGVETQATSLSIKLNLAGAYDTSTGSMRTTLKENKMIPLTQPYAAAPFTYAGTESFAAILDMPTDAVDWVLVEIKNNTTSILKKAAILKANGQIVDAVVGSDSLSLGNIVTGNYKVIVRHRNHLAIATDTDITINANTKTILDFTNNNNVKSLNQEVLLLDPLNKIYGMKKGNINGDSLIDNVDKNSARTMSGSVLYGPNDVNLDGVVNAVDKAIVRLAPNSSEVI